MRQVAQGEIICAAPQLITSAINYVARQIYKLNGNGLPGGG